jgi:uncharacterized damage-inducible protein DinB
MTPILADMYAHLRWADRRTLAMLRDAGDAAPEALRLYAHIIGAERIWLDRILGREYVPDPWPALNFDQCEETLRNNGAEFEAVLSDPSRFNPASTVEYRNVTGALFRSSLSDILIHIALHGAYHRGQVAKLLRQGGCSVLPTDYIVYCREEKHI